MAHNTEVERKTSFNRAHKIICANAKVHAPTFGHDMWTRRLHERIIDDTEPNRFRYICILMWFDQNSWPAHKHVVRFGPIVNDGQWVRNLLQNIWCWHTNSWPTTVNNFAKSWLDCVMVCLCWMAKTATPLYKVAFGSERSCCAHDESHRAADWLLPCRANYNMRACVCTRSIHFYCVFVEGHNAGVMVMRTQWKCKRCRSQIKIDVCFFFVVPFTTHDKSPFVRRSVWLVNVTNGNLWVRTMGNSLRWHLLLWNVNWRINKRIQQFGFNVLRLRELKVHFSLCTESSSFIPTLPFCWQSTQNPVWQPLKWIFAETRMDICIASATPSCHIQSGSHLSLLKLKRFVEYLLREKWYFIILTRMESLVCRKYFVHRPKTHTESMPLPHRHKHWSDDRKKNICCVNMLFAVEWRSGGSMRHKEQGLGSRVSHYYYLSNITAK